MSVKEKDSRTDYAERARHEEALIPQLEKLNAEVEDRIRASRILIESLPIPLSTTKRNSQRYWSKASKSLANKFPLLFKTKL